MSKLEHRIPPPIVVVLLGVAMWLTARYTSHGFGTDELRTILATAVSVFGLVVGGSGFRAFGRAKTTIDPIHLDAASVLVTNGIFRFTRNPMYVGFTALLLAWAIFLAAPWSFLGVVLFVLFIGRFQILPEERVMRAKFGAAYEDYRRRVRRWL